MARSDTEQVVLDVLVAHAEDDRGKRRDPSQPTWVPRFGYGDLSSLIDREWKRRFPDRRNRPTFRNVERVLRSLTDEGLIETRVDDSVFIDKIWYRAKEKAS